MNIIRSFLSELIDEKGVTLTHISRKSGLSVDLLSKSINGTRKISADEFIKICKALEVSNDEITELTSKFANNSKTA